MLTRNEMIEVFRSGGSVSINGVHYPSIESLPSEAELAGSDPVKIAEAKAKLQGDIEAAHSELKKLQVEEAASVKPAKAKTAEVKSETSPAA
jgi:hypothetical protein